MLSNLHAVVSKGYLARPKVWQVADKFKDGLRQKLTFDKSQTSYNDLLDSLRLGLKAYEIQ